jgi:hypothetical protein
MEEKRLFELAKMWIVGSGASFGFYGSEADYDISDVWKNPDDGNYHIEINYFENGKYYATSRTMPKEFVLEKNREDAFGKLGI